MLLILLLVVVLPIWIIAHYTTKNRALKTLTPEEETLLAELWESAQKMEERIEVLEKILDQDSPGWRERHEPF